jgi:hypothetical protein
MELNDIAKILRKVNSYTKKEAIQEIVEFLEKNDNKSRLEMLNMYYPEHCIIKTKEGLISLDTPSFLTGKPREGFFLEECKEPLTGMELTLDSMIDLSEYGKYVSKSAIEYLSSSLIQICIHNLTKYATILYFSEGFSVEEVKQLHDFIKVLRNEQRGFNY